MLVRRSVLTAATCMGVAVVLGLGPSAAAAATTPPERAPSYPIANESLPAGAERLNFEVGPIMVRAGQNSISFTRRIPQPSEDGWIVGMRTNLHDAQGNVPPVNVIHLHHGVWINLSAQDATSHGPQRFFAAGEEKTILELPKGYGYQYHATDKWVLNYMLHNNTPNPEPIWITYAVDFIPASSPAAQGIQPAFPVWMDVENPSAYPVFNAIRGSGHDGQYTFPDDATDPYGSGPPRNEWVVPEDGVLLTTAGHLHPGGMHDDLWLTRTGAKAPKGTAKPGSPDTTHLFSSVADYFEPAGKVSWDFASTATPTSWRPIVHKGDVMSITTTYDTKDQSWYEDMGIMVVWMTTDMQGGVNPFQTKVEAPGVLTHGHLPENDQHGGKPAGALYENLLKAPSHLVKSGTVLPISDFEYVGDMSGTSSIPTIKEGGTLVFRNDDAAKGVWHTITACKAPCDLTTGIAYPTANASIPFDSGELGFGGPPSSGSITWSTPTNLPPGTYTYFCRIHPFMRGAFRVVK